MNQSHLPIAAKKTVIHARPPRQIILDLDATDILKTSPSRQQPKPQIHSGPNGWMS